LAWKVFKRFAVMPVDSTGGRECEELWFEASDGGPERDRIGYFDFVRQFLQDTKRESEFHESITAHFTCDASVQLGLGEASGLNQI